MRAKLHNAKRWLALLLSLNLLLSCVPMPALAQEATCGIPAHTHSSACDMTVKALACVLSETAVHAHTDSCYDREPVLTCQQEHTHEDSCYSRQLVCTRSTETPHTHVDSCYLTRTTRICNLTEHTHTDSCYPKTVTEEVTKSAASAEATEAATEPTKATEAATEPTKATEAATEPTKATEAATEPAEEEEIAEEIAEEIPEDGSTEETTEETTAETEPELVVGAVSDDAANADSTVFSTGSINISTYTAPVRIYNYLTASNTDGTNIVASQNNIFTLTDNDNATTAQDITIGGDESLSADDDKKPLNTDIQIHLDGIVLPEANTMTILPVYPGGTHETVIEVKAESTLHHLLLEDKAEVQLKLEADLTVHDLILAGESSLTVDLNGHKLTLGTVNGKVVDETTTTYGNLILTDTADTAGTASINGAATVNKLNVEKVTVNAAGITANAVSLEGATVNGGGKAITARTSLSTVSSSVSNASLLGFDGSATGTVNMTITGSSFTNITTVGAGTGCTALVRFNSGASVNTETGVTYVRDYTITYQGADGADKTGWITSYRVSSSMLSSNATIVTENKTLPVYAPDGYTYQGWKLNGTTIQALTDQTGDLTLELDALAEDVTVTLDLGFVPSAENSDGNTDFAGQQKKQLTQKLDTVVELPTPDRFGYVFGGWKLGDQTYEDSYTIILGDLTDRAVTLEAVWKEDSFPLNWTFAGIEMEYIQISVDGGSTWATPAEFAAAYSSFWKLEGAVLSNENESSWIHYGETLGAYFERLGMQYPILWDSRMDTAPDDAQDFRTWALTTQPVAENTLYGTDSENSLLSGKEADEKWSDYQTRLKATPLGLTSSFGTAVYQLYIAPVSGWTYYVDGVKTTPANGVIQVYNGQQVSLSIAANSKLSISSWVFAANKDVDVAEEYNGGGTIYYHFTMPACDVRATYSTDANNYVDIAKGAITFETITHNGITRKGFWYPNRLPGGKTANFGIELQAMTALTRNAEKGYFYIWDYAKPIHVTSDGVGTPNQLTLDTTITVNFRDVDMTPRQEFLEGAVGRTIHGVAVERPRDTDAGGIGTIPTQIEERGGIKGFGNIVLTQDGNTTQTFNLVFDGTNNRVGSIFPDQYYYEKYTTLNIKGTSRTQDTLTLGTVFANSTMNIQNITIQENSKNNSEYLLHAIPSGASGSLTNATVIAPSKEIYIKDSSFSVNAGSKLDIGTLMAGQSLYFYQNTDVRIREDAYIGYSGLHLYENAHVVVDGNFLLNYYHWTTDESINAPGAVMIVKGNRCDLGNRRWKAGTLICNALVFGRVGSVRGGTVIANQIMNTPSGNWNVKSGQTEYQFTKTSQLEAVSDNGDTFPFLTYSQSTSDQSIYSFDGGETYLLGYYRTSGDRYDTTVTVKDTPVGVLLAPMLDADGGYNGALVDTAAALAAVQNSAYNNNECVILGNSRYNTVSRGRTVNITGDAKVYAAGNLTFFNQTNVTGGTVWCGGTFGSKDDITITGGSVTAREVGIAYDLTTKLEDNTLRYRKLTVTGGTVDAGRVGTLSACASNASITPRGAADIDPACLTDCDLIFDDYVNYMLGNGGFRNPSTNVQAVRVEATVAGKQADYSAKATEFAAPTMESGGTGTWKLDSLNGETVTGVNTDAIFVNGETSLTANAYERDRVVLFAAKENYQVKVIGGAEHIVSVNDEQDKTAYDVPAGKIVTVKVDTADNAAHKTVIWYTDAMGQVHNPGYTASGDTVTFTMPYSDVEVQVQPQELELDLAKHPVTFTTDGFRTTLSDTVGDQGFHYTGDLKVVQSTFKITAEADQINRTPEMVKTPYRMRVLSDVNNMNAGRKFTLENIAQEDTPGSVGLTLEDGAAAKIHISGIVSLVRTQVPENADIHMLGAVANNREANRLSIHGSASFEDTNKISLGNNFGKAGDITLENLRILTYKSDDYFQTMCEGQTKNSAARVLYKDCNIDIPDQYTGSALATNMGELVIDNCNVNVTNAKAWSDPLIERVDYVRLINGTVLTYLEVGNSSSDAESLLMDIKQSLTVDNSTVNVTLRNSVSGTTYNVANNDNNYFIIVPRLILKNGGVYTSEERLRLKTLQLDGGTMNAGNGGNGYLFADEIIVNDGQLNAKQVILSGFDVTNRDTKEKVITNLSGTNPTLDNSGSIVINGGVVNVTDIGGDRTTTITVNGGKLNADRIGTLGAVYGYARYIPKVGEEWIYSVKKVPGNNTKCTINITGGEVTAAEYLGGINAQVNISGGKINLPAGAVLGITEQQQSDLEKDSITNNKPVSTTSSVTIYGGRVQGEGSIRTPYCATTISGADTAVKVSNILAHLGDVTILQSKGEYTYESEKMGVYVSDTLSAQDILIDQGAYVYAKNAIAVAPEATDTGSLTVVPGSRLYTENYGSDGEGTVTISGEEMKEIFPKARQYSITYHLRDDAEDRALNSEDNVFVYTFSETGEQTLHDATRNGFVFKGWYATEEQAENYADHAADKLSGLKYSYGQDAHLYAAWEPKLVQFQVVINQASMTGLTGDLSTEYGNMPEADKARVAYDPVNQTITYTDYVSIPYRAGLYGTTEASIDMNRYLLPSFGFGGVNWGSNYLDPLTATVDKALLKAYEESKDTPIVLRAVNGARRNQPVTLDLNRVNGLPKDAVFQPNNANVKDDTIFAYASLGSRLDSVTSLLNGSVLNQPSAPGYTFKGWYENKNGTGEQVDIHQYKVTADQAPYFYARWEPNTYKLVFNSGEGNLVTRNGSKPGNNDVGTLTAKAVYDQPLENGLRYEGDDNTYSLPSAWKKGAYFAGWKIRGTDILLTGEETLNLTEIPNLVLSGDSALTLDPVYEELTIIYHSFDTGLDDSDMAGLENGWITKEETVTYGETLWGYSIVNDATDTADYTVVKYSQQEGKTHAILSTTAEYYKSHEAYVSGDYRSSGLVRKGYTFQGWQEKGGAAVHTIPEYPADKTLELWGTWKANTYSLTLTSLENDEYNTYYASDPDSPAKVTGITVDQEINASGWPSRNGSWYAQALNNPNADQRYLLGFTFDEWQPGNQTEAEKYGHYANQIVPTLINSDVLFSTREQQTPGSVFQIPEDWEYSGNQLPGAEEVPDYPDGSDITLYAIYRERSLVFIEYYVDGDTQVENVLKSVPYGQYSNYPNEYVPDSYITDTLKYQLNHWAVGVPNGEHYPASNPGESAWKEKIGDQTKGWIKAAMDRGSYDINVYTYFVAHDEATLQLYTKADPTVEHSDPQTYLVPKSMKEAAIHYELDELPAGVTLVSKDDLVANRFDPDHAGDIAVQVQLINTNNVTVENGTFWLPDKAPAIAVNPGWRIQVTVYHSAVIPENQSKIQIPMHITFDGIAEQKIDLTLDITRNHSQWNVTYEAQLPEDEHRKVDNANGYTGTGNTLSKTVTGWPYGSELLDLIPQLEGYEGVGQWTFGETSFAYGAAANVPVNAAMNGKFTLTTEYKAIDYTLTVEDEAEDRWTVSRTGKVPYHTEITLKPNGTQEAAYIWLDYAGSSYRLDLLKDAYPFFAEKNDDGSYTFLMPAGDVNIRYDNELDLYLDNGTISITENGYTQVETTGNQEVYWPGNYRIWQDETNNTDFHATANVLNLSDDLSDRTITLGKLNITSDDSIALAAGAKASLVTTGDTRMNNIRVPGTGELTLSGGQNMTLTPVKNVAAIGGNNEASGSITVDNMKLDVTMAAGSSASAIGPGNDTAHGAAVTVKGGSLKLSGKSTMADGAYNGTWLGNEATEQVLLDGLTLTVGNDSGTGAVTDGKQVTLNNCTIGTEAARINNNPIQGETVNVNSSRIYMTGSKPLLAPDTILNVDANPVKDAGNTKIHITGSFAEPYSGTLKICDPKADVVIGGSRLLEIYHGDITITATGSKQGTGDLTHNESYRLLSAYDDYDGETNLTVEAMGDSARVFTEADVVLGTVTAKGDAAVEPLGMLETDKLVVEKDALLTVTAKENTGITTETLSGDGSYSQEGGSLTGTGNLVVGGNMTLEEVTVEAAGHNVGSDATGPDNKVTTVTLKDAKITAEKVGAIGVQSEGFTFVVKDSDSTYTGTLVQDHYRLHYNLNSEDYKTEDNVPVSGGKKLETVLRSETANGTTTYLPAIPDDPDAKAGKTSNFAAWYYNGENAVKVALSKEAVPGFTQKDELDNEQLTYAEETDPEDGTRTLELYASMNLSAKASILPDRRLNQMALDETKNSAAIVSDGAWTARFDVTGTVTADAAYQFVFTKALPVGTRLTLAFRDENAQPVFGYYVTNSAVTTVNAADFTVMAGSKKLSFFTAEDQTTLFTHSLQLSADFSRADSAPEGGDVALRAALGSDTLELAKVSYTVTAAPTATVTAKDQTVTVKNTQDARLEGKTLYLTATLTADNFTAVPYGAEMKLGSTTGTWLGGNTACFKLGTYQALNKSDNWTLTGLEGGSYSIQWKLYAAEDGENPFGTSQEPARNLFEDTDEAVLLAQANAVSYKVEAEEDPWLTAELVRSGVVFEAGEDISIDFTYETNADTVKVKVQEQNALKTYLGGTWTECFGGKATVTIPGNEGVYRVRFSINDYSDWDDVYFTFIVK